MLWTSRNKNKALSSSSKYPKKSHVHAPKSESCLGGILDTNTVLKKTRLCDLLHSPLLIIETGSGSTCTYQSMAIHHPP